MSKFNYVIVGNGIAGLSAVKEIRKQDKESSILMLSKEDHPTYYRIRLSHYISKDFQAEELYLHDRKWYQDNDINLITASEVTDVSFEEKLIKVNNSDEYSYDKILFANGSHPFIPPVKGWEKEGVFALRTIDDLNDIQECLKSTDTIIVVGGGLLGLEAAWEAKKTGKDVEVIEFFPYLLPRQLDPEISESFTKILERKGLKFRLGVSAEEIKGNERIESLDLNDGSNLQGGCLLFSAGIRSNIGIFKNKDIKVNRGVVVDNKMRTSVDGVYAAGDVAEYEGLTLGIWPAAQDQGKIAGKNMLGDETEYEQNIPQNILKIADISVFSVGEIKEFSDSLLSRDGDNIYKFYLKGNKIVGGVLIGDTSKMLQLKRAVIAGMEVDNIEKYTNALDLLAIL